MVATDTMAEAGVATLDRLLPRLDDASTASGRLELLSLLSEQAARLRAVVDRTSIPAPNTLFPPLPPIEDAHRDISASLAQLRETLLRGETAAGGLRQLLAGPSRYLVLAANNAEMRAGGMVLQIGLLQSRNGSLDTAGFRSTGSSVLSQAVPVPGKISSLYGFLEPGREWRNTGTSPDFPAIAPVYAAMAAGVGLGEVDGVLQIDVVALRHILEVLGPVTVGDHRYDARNVERLVMHDLYVAAGAAQDLRRLEFSDLAEATFEALNDRRWDAAAMVRALGDAAAGRHILAWSRHPAQQAAWSAAGIDGALDADGLMVAVQNHGGNKLDWFLQVGSRLEVSPRPGGWRRLALTVDIANHYPASEPQYVAGDGSSVAAGAYRAFVTFYLPSWATNVEPRGAPVLASGPDGPMRVVAVRLDIPRGGTKQLTVEFSAPPEEDRIVLLPSARARPVPFRMPDATIDDGRRRFIEL